MLNADDLQQEGSLRVTVVKLDSPHVDFELLGRLRVFEHEELRLGLGQNCSVEAFLDERAVRRRNVGATRM